MSSSKLKLATILQNPGEPATQTRYADPHELRSLGYNGLVLYETTALSGVEGPDGVDDPELRRWVAGQFELVRQRIDQARGAGLAVYVCYDVLSLSRRVVDQAARAMVCKNRSGLLCPASDEALERCGSTLAKFLEQLPRVDGVVIRFGDSDAVRLPYLQGNDIYQPRCPRCESMGTSQRICNVVDSFCRLVVGQLGKRLIVRAWNVRPGGMHDSVELCRQVIERFEGGLSQQDRDQDRLVWSFKFTQADFWRYQRWNEASLVAAQGGRWPIIYELQCQREFEGKGGVPNWQVPLWCDGAPECGEKDRGGLARIASQVKLAGLWAWVRGGGWGGPFVSNEAWIDANVFAVPVLADHPDSDQEVLAGQWISQRLKIDHHEVCHVIKQILEHSHRVILNGFYIGPYATGQTGPWDPNGQWIQDDLINAEAAWQMIRGLALTQLDQVVQEKQEATEQTAQDRARLQRLVDDDNRSTIEPLVNTLLYAESLLSAMQDLFAGLVAFRRYLEKDDPEMGKRCQQKLFGAQAWWNHHTQRHGALPGTATAFRETRFWELTQHVLGQVSEAVVLKNPSDG